MDSQMNEEDSKTMPQLNSSSNEAEPSVSVDDSNNDTSKEEITYRRKLRTRAKNESSGTPAKEPTKKAVKRKQPEKKTLSKSTKTRVSKSKQESSLEEQHTVKASKMKVQPKKIEIEESTDEEDMEEGEIPSSIAAESRTFYSCKLCHKDFSSAFILCLHLRIHEKVASTQTTEENISTVATTQSKDKAVKIDSDDNVDTNTSKVEVQESSIKVESCKPVLNKNFVENLKKNLSLAMNRNL